MIQLQKIEYKRRERTKRDRTDAFQTKLENHESFLTFWKMFKEVDESEQSGGSSQDLFGLD